MVASVLDVQSLLFLLKKMGFAPWCGCCSIVGWRRWGEWVGEGGSFNIGRPRSRGLKYFASRWTLGWEVLKTRQFSWTSYVYCPLGPLLFNVLLNDLFLFVEIFAEQINGLVSI